VCGRSGHTNNKCWEAGGGCEGKAPDWWKKKWSLACTSKDEESSESAALTHATTTHHGLEGEQKGEQVSVPWNNHTTRSLALPTSEHMAVAQTKIQFYFDTGATSHISPNHVNFSKFESIEPRSIHSINGSAIATTGIGKIKLRCGKGRHLTLNRALYTPQASLSLVSVGRLGDEGCTTIFNSKTCTVQCNNKALAEGEREGKKLY